MHDHDRVSSKKADSDTMRRRDEIKNFILRFEQEYKLDAAGHQKFDDSVVNSLETGPVPFFFLSSFTDNALMCRTAMEHYCECLRLALLLRNIPSPDPCPGPCV